MAAFAHGLTREVGATDHDLAPLREVGLDDRSILDLVQVVAYFNFVTRMAEGLGVELEPHHKRR